MLEKIVKDPTKVLAVGRLLMRDFERCDLFRHASAMSYVTVFSIIPSLAAITAILSSFSPLFMDDVKVFGIAGRLFDDLTPAAINDIIGFIDNMLATIDFKALGASGIVVLFFSLAFLMRQIELAFNRIWLIRKNRNLIKRFLYFWTFTTLSLFGLSLGLAMFANFKLTSLLHETAQSLQSYSFLNILRNWVACFGVFVALYKIIPNCKVRFTDAFAGALVATICLQIVTKLYGVFISSVANYRTLYGTLAALPTFLLWLYLCWLIILLGALFAWRWHQGFPIEKLDDESHAEPSIDSIENFRSQIWATLLSLIKVHKSFMKGDKPTTVMDIHKSSGIPLEIVSDQVDLLVKLKLVAVAHETQATEMGPSEHALLPTQPSHKVNIMGTMKSIFGELDMEEGSEDHQTMQWIFAELLDKRIKDFNKVRMADFFQ